MAARRPEPWWHPLRSDPAIAKGLTIWAHLLAIGIALVGTVVLGFAIGTSATAVAWLSDEIAGVFAAIGIMLFFTVLFSWAGHLPGAVMLHYALVRGKGGWAVAMAGGLAIGVALSALIGSVLAALLGPFLALAHLAALRWMASLFRPRGDRIAPSGCGAPQ